MAELNIASASLEPALSGKKRRRTAVDDEGKPHKTRKKKNALVECPVCLDQVVLTKLHFLPSCNCAYCTACLIEAFQTGLSNKSLNFPATCCGRPLDVEFHEKKLPGPLRRAYRHAMEEMASNNPLYCAFSECGAFIPAASTKDGFGTCGLCHMKTCEKCKQLKREHLGKHTACPDHLKNEDLERLATEKGWKRCPKCYTLIEKTYGCDHMRCRCKTEWCYTCGKTIRGAERCICHQRSQLGAMFPTRTPPTPPLLPQTPPPNMFNNDILDSIEI